MRKAILYKERTAEGRMLRKAYDTHKCSFQPKMKHRTPRIDGLSNTITSFFTDNLVLIIKEVSPPTIKTTIDTSNMTFVTTMNKEIIHTAPNGKKYSISIRKYTPRDCFRLMGVHEADIDKLLSKEKDGSPIICKSKLYALAGNSIVTNCLTLGKWSTPRRLAMLIPAPNDDVMAGEHSSAVFGIEIFGVEFLD